MTDSTIFFVTTSSVTGYYVKLILKLNLHVYRQVGVYYIQTKWSELIIWTLNPPVILRMQ